MTELVLKWGAAFGLATPAILLAGWLFRQLIITRLARSVAHEFDQKIERVRSTLTQERARETAITAAALGVVTAAQASASSARIDAAAQLWKKVLELRNSNSAVAMLDILTADELAQLASARPQHLKDLIAAHPEVCGSLQQRREFLTKFEGIEEVRPLISDAAWAYYFGYRAFTFRILCLLQQYQERHTFVSPLEDKGLKQIAASMLTPAELEHSRKMTVGRLLFGLGIIEKKLLDELRDGIAGKQASEDSLKRAQQIVATVTLTEQQAKFAS